MTSGSEAFLPLLDIDSASEDGRSAMERGRKSAGQLINMYRGMAHAPGLLDTYIEGTARFRMESGFTPTEQEVVFLTISILNDCRYCVAGHSTLADRRGIDRLVIDALRDGRPLDNPRHEVLRTITEEVLRAQGRLAPESMRSFVEAGFSAQQVLYIILAVGLKAMSNSTNHLLDTPVDAAFQERAWPDHQGS